MSTLRKSQQEQYQLVMECRASSLTDYQWCKQNGIRPGTFYNWVSRLRKKTCDIPASASENRTVPLPCQDVVRLDLVRDEVVEVFHAPAEKKHTADLPEQAPVVIHLQDASISLLNTVDPHLPFMKI